MNARLEEITTGTKAWWSSRQDDFVKEVRGAGFDTHSLYDVPAALAEYTYNLESELAALREENARLRGALPDFIYRSVLTLSQDKELAKAVREAIELNWAALSPSPAKEQAPCDAQPKQD